MSIKLMMHVFHESKSKGNDRLVLLAIAAEATDQGHKASPSMRCPAAKANCNKDTVAESIKRLEALGELQVKRPAKQGPGFSIATLSLCVKTHILKLSGNPGQGL